MVGRRREQEVAVSAAGGELVQEREHESLGSAVLTARENGCDIDGDEWSLEGAACSSRRASRGRHRCPRLRQPGTVGSARLDLGTCRHQHVSSRLEQLLELLLDLTPWLSCSMRISR